jgi:RNA recognition motif-containing protein
MATTDVSGVAGVNTYNSLHPRKLFISGLTKIYKEADVDIRRAELERAFQKFGGSLGARVIVPTKSTFAFVEFESERQADLALNEMSKQYRLNRARRSKHEALQEERAAKEASQGVGGNKQSSEWN